MRLPMPNGVEERPRDACYSLRHTTVADLSAAAAGVVAGSDDSIGHEQVDAPRPANRAKPIPDQACRDSLPTTRRSRGRQSDS